jgi:hypothetical protein
VDIFSNITDRDIQRPGMLVAQKISQVGPVGCTNDWHNHPSSRTLILHIAPVTPLVLQEDFRDHTGLLNNPNMDIQSELMKYHSEFLIGSTFQICSPIGNIAITLRSHQ